MAKVNEYEVKEGLYYHKGHFWVRLESGLARFGITDYGQKGLKEVVNVELPEKGSEVKQDEAYGVVESVKAVVDLVAPLSGTVKEIHEDLRDKPTLINQDPYGEGWLLVVKASDVENELKNLLTFNDAVNWYKELGPPS